MLGRKGRTLGGGTLSACGEGSSDSRTPPDRAGSSRATARGGASSAVSEMTSREALALEPAPDLLLPGQRRLLGGELQDALPSNSTSL